MPRPSRAVRAVVVAAALPCPATRADDDGADWSAEGDARRRAGRRAAPVPLPRTAYIRGTNARSILTSHGWTETKKMRNATLLWLRKRKRLARYRPDPLRQIFNMLPTNMPLTDKGQLFENVAGYEKKHALEDGHLPETYFLNTPARFMEMRTAEMRKRLQDGGVWILKDVLESQGNGITIIPDSEKWLMSESFARKKHRPGGGYVLQRYIINPLLLTGKKSELRLYWAVLSLFPLLVVGYYEGQVRLNSMPYQHGDYSNRLRHITNVHQQHDHPEFDKLSKSGMLKWTLDAWARYCVDELGHSRQKVHETVFQHAREAVVRAVNASWRRCVEPESPHYGNANTKGDGQFELFGSDFILTDRLRVYMTEVQMGPGLSHSDPVKARVLLPALSGAANLALEVLQRRREGRSLAELDSLAGSGYSWLINAARSTPYYFSVKECTSAGGGPRNPLCEYAGEGGGQHVQ